MLCLKQTFSAQSTEVYQFIFVTSYEFLPTIATLLLRFPDILSSSLNLGANRI